MATKKKTSAVRVVSGPPKVTTEVPFVIEITATRRELKFLDDSIQSNSSGDFSKIADDFEEAVEDYLDEDDDDLY